MKPIKYPMQSAVIKSEYSQRMDQTTKYGIPQNWSPLRNGISSLNEAVRLDLPKMLQDRNKKTLRCLKITQMWNK